MKSKKLQKLGVWMLVLEILLFSAFFFLRDSLLPKNLDAWHAYIYKAEMGYLMNETLTIILGVGIWLICRRKQQNYHRLLIIVTIGVHVLLLIINLFQWFRYDAFAIVWLAALGIITTWIYRVQLREKPEKSWS